ncbi:TPA: GBS Bsp-like repeat-containing protein [Streptococcus suis]|uniref:GBS Bsp-like repeat-containing protein n=2 Tax=Streptococcus suis TaxID=1307 RepID=UPI0027423156|nr:GBS Bsp-like repeat-containing protein [Streptococcus suis]HEL1572872.1 GBS Bsp-like repeat-containing protein [Streptococcus suis]HEL1685172.1 GBS Bsp-like repeat-containing protein [Streptococcus suis]HEL1710250.1 GBS Bsp-like repeat-containing protein [Streptococcus suis]HEL2021539.1 GBS Bsp-like repeat-containing protein [Streptococcus suis]HEL2076923.1 GBS Bsp-like repeat-containing protein [Streptococcus suis]
MFLHVKYIKEIFVKKRTLLFLSLCASALNAQLVQADMVNAPSSQVSSAQVAETGGQLSVVDEAGQIKAILSNIQGEIIGVTAQFSSETNSGITVTFSMDEQGRYVAVLDRSAFAEEDQVFSLKLTAQLTDGSFQTLSDYSFEWKKDVVSAAEKPTALDNSDATPSKIEEEATSTTTSSTVNSSLTAGATSSTSNSLTRSSSNTIAGSSNGSTSVPSARVSTASSSVNVTQPTGTITIENRNDAQGTFDVRVTNVSSPKDIASVLLPTWSQSDDIRWYEATRQSDGSYKLTVNKKDHKYRTGTYTVHLYYKDSSGGLTGAGGTTTHLSEVKPTGTITIENRNDAQGTFDVRVTNVSSPKDISSVILPTWSQTDDLRWYEATRQSDGSYKLTVNKKDHKYRTGTYTVHLYYKDSSGGLTGAGGTTTHLSEVKPTGTITIENRNDAQGTFDVRVTNVSSPKDISSVILPTWSQTDDLRWYEAKRQADGSYKLTVNKRDHKYRTGTYTVHLYYKDSNGGLTGAGGTTTHLSEVKPTGTITIENRNDAQGTFDVRVTNISSPKDIASIILPTWSQTDDLRWYEATRQSDGSYKLTVNKKDHKYRTGTYTVHLYYKDSNGGLTGAGGTTTHLSEAKPTGTITIENRNDAQGTFDVRVTNISSPKDIASVLLPTWSQSDDIRWYEATRQSDGSYKLTVNKKDHKYRTGTYTVHLYYKDSNGGLTGAGGTTTHLSEVKPTGTITIENRNDAQGTFDVRVTNVSSPKDIASVLLPTWSQSDDIRWYEATRQSDGSYKLTVNKKDHKYRTGTYTVHLYYKDSNGGLTGAGGTTTHLSNPSAQRSYTVYIDPGHGGRDSGASYGGVHEKNLALSVSNKLRENLLQYGINVLMTRTGDYDVDFKTERSRMTNASNADLFISIHFNATGAGVSNATGIETYWYQYNPEYQPKINKEMHNNPTRLAESEILANKVQESLIKETGAVNRGVRRETFAVLRETAIPAILVELGFMDNPSELQVIKQDSYHTRLAKALAQGVMNWYGAVEGK